MSFVSGNFSREASPLPFEYGEVSVPIHYKEGSELEYEREKESHLLLTFHPMKINGGGIAE